MYKNNNIYIMSLANTTEGNSVGAEVVSKNGEESEFNFSLRPMEGFNCFVGEVNIQFLPSNNQQNNRKLQLPRFNNDGLYHTPSFITDNEKYQMNTACSIKQQKVINTNSELYIAKPSSNFCQVCKIKFPDYLSHIRSYYHQNMLQKSQFQKQIKNFSDEFHSFLAREAQKFSHGNKKVKKSFDATKQ